MFELPEYDTERVVEEVRREWSCGYAWRSEMDHSLREWSVYVPIVVLTALIVLLSVVGGAK